MQKPIDYDQSQAQQFGDYSKPAPGAYIMKIVAAKEQMSKSGRPMLVLALDIAEGEFKNHFKNLFDFLVKKNNQTTWPCVHRRCTDRNQISYFKGDIKIIEESNSGFIFNFTENTLIGKRVGCMLGEKETQSGKIILEPKFLCSVEKALSGTLQPPKMKQSNNPPTSWDDSNEGKQEDLPF